ncbi:MAG: NADH-quinone oxidoreductase subunit N [Deltaproteobacteria bacterium CG_4_10_14_3_um_filter_60_8]|nr:MAG: NADH-quinone oxidoreductase subunit N [Deltaproteobacteria bacterium CG_4_10_14_3_um_filter_60_8]
MKLELLFAPELFLLLGSLVLFFLTLGDSRGNHSKSVATVIGVINLGLCLFCLHQQGELFYHAYRVDLFSQFFKLIIAAGFLVVLLLGRALKGVRDGVRSEYYLFMLLSVLGLVMLVSSVELLTMMVALELSSFTLYLLVPMRDEATGERAQMEAAVKYILFGVVATGIMLFGMSYLFGLTGTTYLSYLLPQLRFMSDQPAVLVGIVMVMAGFFYKLGVFPMHFWVPDVYQGASNETTAFIASVPKLAAVALLIRLVTLVMPADHNMPLLLTVLAVGSMLYGNLLALVQKDIKRMLGFSGIAHAGYLLLGLLIFKDAGFATAIYYIMGYLVMTLACFLVICKVSAQGENLKIEDLAGLHHRAPLLALTMAVGMFALAGIPPFVGFMGKFMLLTQALKHGYLPLVIITAINTAISLYYYLSVVRVAYCTDTEDRPMVPVDGLTRAVSVVLMLLILAMGLAPSGILDLATSAIHGMPGGPFL